ncbi:MAG: helix-turn-helix transcriptional regulator [Bacteroidota bacterium]
MKYTRNNKAIKLVGAQLKKQRIRQDISQTQLAFEANLPVNQIGRIERGEINTSISQLIAIANALHIHPSKLFPLNSNFLDEH